MATQAGGGLGITTLAVGQQVGGIGYSNGMITGVPQFAPTQGSLIEVKHHRPSAPRFKVPVC